jgi:hypothetical protein
VVGLSVDNNNEQGGEVFDVHTWAHRDISRRRGNSVAKVGRDTISHPDRGHDDVANAVAGAAALTKFGGYDTSLRWVSGDDDDSDAAWQRVRLQAFINSGGRIRL